MDEKNKLIIAAKLYDDMLENSRNDDVASWERFLDAALGLCALQL